MLFNFIFKPPNYRRVVGGKVSTSDLLRQRASVPGILIFIFSAIIIFGAVNSYLTPDFWPLTVSFCIALGPLSYFIGFIYNIVFLRKFVKKIDHQFFTERIKKILFETGKTLKISPWKKNKIISSSAIMDIFFDFVDRDDFLHQIYNNYIKNKYYLIIFFDIILFSFSFSIISSLLIFILDNPLFYLITMIFGSFIFCSSYYFYGKFYKKNIIIENQQIDFIIIRYEKELKKKIYALYF